MCVCAEAKYTNQSAPICEIQFQIHKYKDQLWWWTEKSLFSNQMAVWYKTCIIITIFCNKTFHSKNISDLKSLIHSIVEFSWAKMSKIYDSGTGITKNAVFITAIWQNG